MFNNLIASEDKRKKVLGPRTLVTSIAAHVVLLGGALYAAANAPDPAERPSEEQVTYMEIEPTPPPPAPEPVEPPPPPEVEPEPEPEAPRPDDPPAVIEAPEEPTPTPPVAKGFQELAPPSDVPDRLPDVDASAPPVRAEDFSGVGVAGGISKGVEGGQARNTAQEPPTGASKASSGPVDVNVVEERPSLRNAAEMQRVLQRLYPPLLRDAGVTGQTMLKFVIDANGRVESGSVEVLSSTHDGFSSASIEAADRFRFSPAKIGGRPVRVSISMPISWTLDRA
jgi:protein TonB